MEKQYTREFNGTEKIIAKGIHLFDGEIKHKNAGVPVNLGYELTEVPITLLNYISKPEDKVHRWAAGERFVMWINLSNAEWNGIETQIKKGIREISIFFDDTNKKKLLRFLQC